MNTLSEVLTILDGQNLAPGYLTPLGSTALLTVRALRQQYDPFTLVQNPLSYPQLLMTPAFIGPVAGGGTGIYLDGVDGNLDLSHGAKQPAYVFSS